MTESSQDNGTRQKKNSKNLLPTLSILSSPPAHCRRLIDAEVSLVVLVEKVTAYLIGLFGCKKKNYNMSNHSDDVCAESTVGETNE